MLNSRSIERAARGLTIFTFVLLCWVGHRSLQFRAHCLNSDYLSFVQVDGRRIYNCQYESRLNLEPLLAPISYEQSQILRRLEQVDRLSGFVVMPSPSVVIEIVKDQPRSFELNRNYLHIGSAWLNDDVQLNRALTMAALSTAHPEGIHTQFQLEMLTDFLLKIAFGQDLWKKDGHEFSFSSHVKFPTSAPGFAEYCRSPFRSLAHEEGCAHDKPDSDDLHARVWGLRPLLGSALWRVYDKLSLKEKLAVIQKLRSPLDLPSLGSIHEDGIEPVLAWFYSSLNEHLSALGMTQSKESQVALQRTLKELQVESPTHWELTVDLTKTPAWREILEQLRVLSRFNQKDRVLVFTPQGEKALPADMDVAWAASDVQSQKHVLVACGWPKPREAVPVKARHLYASQSCDKLKDIFW